MANRVLRVRASEESPVSTAALAELHAGIEAIRAEMKLSEDFPAAVDAAAQAAAAQPRLPEKDRTAEEFVTIDPASAQDLDQAMWLERDGDGYVVHYAIADLAAFIAADDPIDIEAHRRGETLYGADSKIPLHPRAISEDAGSLLADKVRPALVWDLRLDAEGALVEAAVEKALVRSRAKLDYAGVQEQIDAGTAPEVFALLAEIGEKRIAQEVARGGVTLPIPEQEIVIEGERARLEFRSMHPVEQWNAQISLLTGIAAAQMMVQAKVGILRTLPEPDPRDVERLRRIAKALRVDWPAEMEHPEFVRSLDPTKPEHAAVAVASTRLLRGSGYAGFDGELPEVTGHSAIAAEYAHCTAPLRRLVDRYAGEVCVALSAGRPVPDWVRAKLPELPETMRESARRANQYENAVLDLLEALVLRDRVGERFDGVVTGAEEKPDEDGTYRGTATIAEPAVEVRVTGTQPLPLGEEVALTLTAADPATRTVAFTLG